MSGARNFPAELLQCALDCVIAHVHRSDEILREITGDMHPVEHESRPQTALMKFGINYNQIAISNAARILALAFQSFSPDAMARNLAIEFRDKNPIRPSRKRRAHPFGINLRRRSRRHLWICVVPAEIVSE